MKLLLVSFLALFFNYPAFSGELEPFLAGGKWGFRDRVTKTIAVSPQFENACAFSEGLACVKSGIGWGYIDETGKMVIPPQKNICRISYPFLNGEALCIFSPLKACERFEKFGGFELFRCIAAPYEGGELSEKQLHRKIDRTGKILYQSTGIKGDGLEVVITPKNKFGYAREFKLAIQPKYNFAEKDIKKSPLDRLAGRARGCAEKLPDNRLVSRHARRRPCCSLPARDSKAP